MYVYTEIPLKMRPLTHGITDNVTHCVNVRVCVCTRVCLGVLRYMQSFVELLGYENRKPEDPHALNE